MLLNNRSSARRVLLLLLAAVLVATLAAACGQKNKQEEGGGAVPGAGEGTVVATYKDGGQVTETEFDKYAGFVQLTDPQTAMYLQIPQFKEQILQQYVMSKVFAGQATDEDREEGDKTAAEFKTQLEAALKEQPELKDMMDESGLTADEAYEFVRTAVAAGKFVEKKRTELEGELTEDDLKAEFDKAPSDYNIITARHILVSTAEPPEGADEPRTDEEALARANEAKDKLEQGGDWATLAKEYSDDPGSKDNGGLYEEQEAGGWVPEFKEAANTQAIGAIGEPVKTDYGYHVIQVEKRDEMTFDKLGEQAKNELKETLLTPKLNEFLQGEQDKMEITITLPQEEETPPVEEGADGGAPENGAANDAASDGEAASENGAATE